MTGGDAQILALSGVGNMSIEKKEGMIIIKIGATVLEDNHITSGGGGIHHIMRWVHSEGGQPWSSQRGYIA